MKLVSINGQGHSLTLVKGHSDFKVKCLNLGLYTQVSDSGPLGPLVYYRNLNYYIKAMVRKQADDQIYQIDQPLYRSSLLRVNTMSLSTVSILISHTKKTNTYFIKVLDNHSAVQLW